MSREPQLFLYLLIPTYLLAVLLMHLAFCNKHCFCKLHKILFVFVFFEVTPRVYLL